MKPRLISLTIALLQLPGLLFVLLTAGAARAELNLYSLSPRTQVLRGITFPRNNLVFYRGINEAQADYPRAVSAMLGDRTANIETPVFFTLKQILMGKTPTLLETFRDIQVEFSELNLQSLAEREVRANGKDFDEAQAIETAKKILSQVYTESYARTRAVDYTSSNRNDFPRAFAYSTIYVEVAKIYSPHILIFDEKENRRSLDVNYWNQVNNGHWVHTNLSYPDRGEFLTPLYIPYNQVVGYQYNRRSFNTNYRVYRALSQDLGLVFMKYTYQNRDYVYAFDAAGLSHVVLGAAGFCGAVSRFDPESEFPELAKMDCLQRPHLISILRTCSDSEISQNTCQVPSSLFSPYEKSEGDFKEALSNLLERTTGNKKVYSFESAQASQTLAKTKTKNRRAQ